MIRIRVSVGQRGSVKSERVGFGQINSTDRKRKIRSSRVQSALGLKECGDIAIQTNVGSSDLEVGRNREGVRVV